MRKHVNYILIVKSLTFSITSTEFLLKCIHDLPNVMETALTFKLGCAYGQTIILI